MTRARVVTDADIALLRSLRAEGSVVAASRCIGISRNRAVYRIARLRQAFGGPVAVGTRGGRGHGVTRLTRLGDRIVRDGFDSLELLASRPVAPPPPSNLLRGIYRACPAPEIRIGKGLRLRVAFAAVDGEIVAAALDPEAVLLARERFPTSARNVVRGEVVELRNPATPYESTLVVRAGPVRIRVAVTAEAVRQLRLSRGGTVWLYVKATALRRVARDPPTALRRGRSHGAAPASGPKA